MKHYTAQEISEAFSSEDNSQSNFSQKIQNDLLDSVLNNLKMTISESDFICSRLTINNYKACEDYIFKTHYLIYRNNLDGTKPAYGFFANSLENEKVLHLKKLHEDYQSWKPFIKKNNHKEVLLNFISKEVKLEIESLEQSRKVLGFGHNAFAAKEKAIILHSKYLYLTVKKIFEDYETNKIIVDFKNSKIEINANSIVHIMYRHMAGSAKQFDTQKSFLMERSIGYDKILTFLKNILEEISSNKILENTSIHYIQFKYKEIIYAIYTDAIKGNLNHFKLKTFYPIEDNNDLQELSLFYKEIKINEDLSVFEKIVE